MAPNPAHDLSVAELVEGSFVSIAPRAILEPIARVADLLGAQIVRAISRAAVGALVVMKHGLLPSARRRRLMRLRGALVLYVKIIAENASRVKAYYGPIFERVFLVEKVTRDSLFLLSAPDTQRGIFSVFDTRR